MRQRIGKIVESETKDAVVIQYVYFIYSEVNIKNIY